MDKKCVNDTINEASKQWFADRESIEQWLGTDNKLTEAIYIITDIYNGNYTVETLRNDVNVYFEPDDRGDINR